MKRSVLVRGVGSHNGGAELLLRSAVEHFEGSLISIYADARRVSRTLRRDWSVGGFVSVPRLGKLESLGLTVLPSAVTNIAGYKATRHLDGVLDASGFFVGDQWSAASIARDAETFRKVAARGKPTIMLPQAFGPFKKADVAAAARGLFSSVDLIFARDQESYDHVAALLGDTKKLGLSPDITIALNVKAKPSQRTGKRVAIVPNVNISARSSESGVKNLYAKSLRDMYERLLREGYEPFFLIHSTHGDPSVVDDVVALGGPVDVETPANGLAAKAVIAQCDGVIAGRYHAIVSALSQGVPAVAHSWSHKYGALLSDFGVTEGLADPLAPDASVDLALRLMGSDAYKQTLHDAKPALVSKVGDMWARVDSLLSSKG